LFVHGLEEMHVVEGGRVLLVPGVKVLEQQLQL
jgi:hypothetical protein